MYATIIRYDMRAITSTDERGRAGRTLATALGELPGFVAFVALDADVGMDAALCIVEDRASLADAHRRIARWHTDAFGTAGAGLEEVGTGAVIAQKGL